MPWVIWDILVPMLATFAIGLAAGWLLWRWRRQQVNVAAPQQAEPASPQLEANDSMNVVLIEERDNAVARAETAESELETLKTEIDLSVMGIDVNQSQVATAGVMADVQVSEEALAEISQLKSQLEKEKASKAEIERSLIDINELYKDQSTRIEQEASPDATDPLKDVATLESNLEKAEDTIAEQQTLIKQLEESEETSKQEYQQQIAEKEALLKQERADREEARTELAREKLAHEQALVNAIAVANTMDSTADSSENTTAEKPAESTPSNKVHHLPVQGAGSGNQSSATEVNTPVETVRAKANEAASDAVEQLRGESEQSAREDTVTTRAQTQSASQSGPSAGAASVATASVAHAEATSISEIEDPDVVEAEVDVEATIDDVTLDEDQMQPEVKVAAVETTDIAASPVAQNVTSINTTPRKPESTEPTDTEVGSKPAAEDTAETKPLTAYVPDGWVIPEQAPLEADRDDLQDIKGVGPVLEQTLHETGIYFYRQIALLDATGVQELDDQLSQFSGRIEREKWVMQANALHLSKYGSAVE